MHLIIRTARQFNLHHSAKDSFQLESALLLLQPLGVSMCHSLAHLLEYMNMEAAAIEYKACHCAGGVSCQKLNHALHHLCAGQIFS